MYGFVKLFRSSSSQLCSFLFLVNSSSFLLCGFLDLFMFSFSNDVVFGTCSSPGDSRFILLSSSIDSRYVVSGAFSSSVLSSCVVSGTFSSPVVSSWVVSDTFSNPVASSCVVSGTCSGPSKPGTHGTQGQGDQYCL